MIQSGAPERSAREVLAQLRADFPDTPFLALGQTVFWDEPVKAVLRVLLDASGLGGRMVVGVHDTDYFAKSRVVGGHSGRFALLPHNDGATRDLWSAAGEISTLFGSETPPTRAALVRYGVPLHRLAKASSAGEQAFVDAVTEAWGWRGLVYTGSRDLIVSGLPLRDVGDGIMAAVGWGFSNAVAQIAPSCCQGEAQSVADTITGWCGDYRESHPDSTLSDLYRHLLPRLYALLLGYEPSGIDFTATSQLLRFGPDTAHLPRFRFVDLFLRPETRSAAESAYNAAVEGSEIYKLDKFGAGALPFDVVVPGRGRGTLRVTPRVVFVETRNPVTIALKAPVKSIGDLAEVLAHKLGNGLTLVGKAVSLISMLAQEFIFVFNEEGSQYVTRTRRMNDRLAAQGMPIDAHPILRIRYQTWDSLVTARSTLMPAEHLARAFAGRTLEAYDFGARWRGVVAEQQALCDRLAGIRKPIELLDFLAAYEPTGQWEARRQAYEAAKHTLIELRAAACGALDETRAAHAELKELNAQSQQVQREMSAHLHATAVWTPEQTARREAFGVALRSLEERKRLARQRIHAARSERWAIERGSDATSTRSTLRDVENDAELARLEIVRGALLTVAGLPHTNHRPSAWWLPMVDSSGAWFRRIVETAELYTQPLISGGSQ
jgi:hypothetical protein